MQFINLQAQYQLISKSVKKQIKNILNHEQSVFANLGYAPEDFPEALRASREVLRASREVLCLPMSPYLSAEDQEKIIRSIQQL